MQNVTLVSSSVNGNGVPKTVNKTGIITKDFSVYVPLLIAFVGKLWLMKIRYIR